MLVLNLILVVFNLINARIDAKKIYLGKSINHFVNGALYIGLTCLIILAYLIFGEREWYFVPFSLFSALLNRQFTFDIPLNLLRKPKLPWNYVSPAVPSATSSKWDNFEVRVMGRNGTVHNIVYLILFVLNIVVYCMINQ